MHNRKKNTVELMISQGSTSKILNEYKEKEEALRYVGSMTIRVVEIEGSFDHVVNIDESQHRFEFPIRSRNKRAKKRRDEFDMTMGNSVPFPFDLFFSSRPSNLTATTPKLADRMLMMSKTSTATKPCIGFDWILKTSGFCPRFTSTKTTQAGAGNFSSKKMFYLSYKVRILLTNNFGPEKMNSPPNYLQQSAA